MGLLFWLNRLSPRLADALVARLGELRHLGAFVYSTAPIMEPAARSALFNTEFKNSCGSRVVGTSSQPLLFSWILNLQALKADDVVDGASTFDWRDIPCLACQKHRAVVPSLWRHAVLDGSP